MEPVPTSRPCYLVQGAKLSSLSQPETTSQRGALIPGAAGYGRGGPGLVDDEFLDGPVLVAPVWQVSADLDWYLALPQLLHGDLQRVGFVLDVHHDGSVHAAGEGTVGGRDETRKCGHPAVGSQGRRREGGPVEISWKTVAVTSLKQMSPTTSEFREDEEVAFIVKFASIVELFINYCPRDHTAHYLVNAPCVLSRARGWGGRRRLSWLSVVSKFE